MQPSKTEPALDADDIQGNILPGFGRDQQWLVGLSVRDAAALKAVLAEVSPRVTSLSESFGRRQEVKEVFQGLRTMDSLEDPLWLNVALGREALLMLGQDKVVQLDTAFKAGMVEITPSGAAVTRTGDPSEPKRADGTDDPAYPLNWVVGGRERLDVLLIFAADMEIAERVAPIVDTLRGLPGVQVVYQELGERLPGDSEHFGFADGISLPGVRGVLQVDGEWVPETTRYGVPPADGVEFGRPGQPLAWPGQFLLGTPISTAGADPKVPPQAKNGSFLVFRRLQQDVRAFYEDTASMAQQLATDLNQASMTPELFRATLVGRWPSGDPLMRWPTAPPVTPEHRLARNYFEYARSVPPLEVEGETIRGAEGDPTAPLGGAICPAWTHIRKTNPRELGTDKGGPELTRRFQMLRRGIPFGPAYRHDAPEDPVNAQPRGLLFLAYQRSIERAFEFLNNDWMNRDDAPPPGHGFDVLVGQNTDSGRHDAKPFQLRGSTCVALRQWVIPTGGAYLFAPSLSALRTQFAG